MAKPTPLVGVVYLHFISYISYTNRHLTTLALHFCRPHIQSNACILFFDVTDRITYRNVPVWYRDVNRVCGRIPIVLVGNKVDNKDRKVKAKSITFHRKRNLVYYDLSARSNYNIDKPFLRILRDLTGDPALAITEEPAHPPQEIVMDAAHIAEMERATIEAAQYAPLPQDDEEL